MARLHLEALPGLAAPLDVFQVIDDADISIVWPGQDTPILSEKDQNWPALRALGIEL